jgi:8-oxo-dGTP pyrophosphatase MutT (NUDIX family)
MADNSQMAWPAGGIHRYGPAAQANLCRRNLPPRRAAILVSLCHCNGEASLLYTLRSHHLSTHAGHVSFPGGHLEPGEMSVDAALRETYEELGEATGSIHIIGKFSMIPAITGVRM